MPSPTRFIVPNEGFGARLRERPLTLTIGALIFGALLGGLVVYQPGSSRQMDTTGSAPTEITSSTPKTAEPVVKAEAAPLADKAVPLPSAKEGGASVDCEQQTWPYLSYECAERKRRSVRVISTDKLSEPLIDAIEASSPAGSAVSRSPVVANPAPDAVASVPAAPAPRATAVPPVAASQPPASKAAAPDVVESATSAPPQPAAPGTVASAYSAEPPKAVAPTPSPLGPSSRIAAVEPSASPPSQPVTATTDIPKGHGKRSKGKKTRSGDRAEAAGNNDQPVDSDRVGDRDRDHHSDRTRDKNRNSHSDRNRDRDRARDNGRSRDGDRVRDKNRTGARVVERWIEREYDVPSDDRAGQRRRVTVIDRGNDRPERVERRGGDFFFGDGGGFPFR